MGLQQTSIRYHNDDLYPHFYLCNYLPGSVGRDTFSNSLLKFKRREHPDLEGWIDCTLEQSAGMLIREDTIILRALHHHEPAANPLRPAALDLLGKALAGHYKCRYLPDLLCKSRPVEEIKSLTREQRVIALHEAYRFNGPPPPDRHDHQDDHNHHDHYLVLDDIVTTGSTMNAVIEAIRLGYLPSSPPSILAFSLAKADYNASFNLFHRLQGRNYRLEQGAQWLLAEQEEAYKTYYSTQTLKNWILGNSFPRPGMQ